MLPIASEPQSLTLAVSGWSKLPPDLPPEFCPPVDQPSIIGDEPRLGIEELVALIYMPG